MPPAIGAAIGGIGSVVGGIFGGGAASGASKEYVRALQQAQKSLLGTEKQGLAQFAPYLGAGNQASGLLSEMLSTPGQGLLTPWTQQFTAPTAAEAAATPGYQFQLQQGENALQNSAAARGGLLSGGTLADLNNYAQGIASTNYQNTFNNALTQYQNSYQTFLNNQNNTYQRLAQQQGVGLGAATGGANLIAGIGGDVASLYGQQGAAKAQGTIGAANAYGSIIPGIGNAITNYGLLSQMSQPNQWNPGGYFGPGSTPDTSMIPSNLGGLLSGMTPPTFAGAPA
jgi:hypothetical protein